MISVEQINQQAAQTRQLGFVLIIIAIVFAIVAVILWKILEISHSIKVITGVGVGKELKKIKEESQSGSGLYQGNRLKSVITWNTSGLLKRDHSSQLSDEQTTVLEECNLSDEQTTVLEESQYGFVIEEEIRITGTDKQI